MALANKRYLAGYHFEGKKYGFDFKAASHEEAERHIRAIGLTGWIDGESVGDIPWSPSWFDRVLAWAGVK